MTPPRATGGTTGEELRTLRTPRDGLRHWAETTPDRVALRDAESSLSFAELQGRVDALSDELEVHREAIADSGGFLPVLVDRRVDSAVALLSCLAARIPFYPVSAGADPEHAAGLFARVGPPRIVLLPTGVSDRSAPVGAHRVRGREPAAPGARPGDAGRPGGDTPGLVVFTSGTTGAPKGVVLDWEALEERWRRKHVFVPDDIATFAAPNVLPLDALYGITVLLDVAWGCSTLLLDPARERVATTLRRIAEHRPFQLSLPSQVARIWAQVPDVTGLTLDTVRRVTVGSEGFRYESLQGLGRLLPASTEVIHSLSSTEAGRVTSLRFALCDAPPSGQLPAGFPEEPPEVRLRPAPEAGDGWHEVLCSGPIAREYFRDPERTAARFEVDDEGRRWWRSGDLVTVDPVSGYHHRGRRDDVVKIRSRLVSPSDVSEVLLDVPGIRSAVVVPHVNHQRTSLIAYVEVDVDADLTLEGLRAQLRHRLPDHAVPGAILRLGRLPTSTRGKVDRSALADGPFVPW